MIKDLAHRNTIKLKHYLEFCILLSSNLVSNNLVSNNLMSNNLVSSCLNFKI